MQTILTIAILFYGFINSKAQVYTPIFEDSPHPTKPDYTDIDNWAAHPQKKDKSDLKAGTKKIHLQALESVDVFFIHPTIFIESPSDQHHWNASLNNSKLNHKVDDSTIKLQASLFNHTGNVYAPRYRQAHLRSFFEPNKKDGDKALELAYSDVLEAFKYYLNHINNGKPFILAGHSQGSRHLVQLIKDLIDDKPLQKQMIAAYIVGWGVDKNEFKTVKNSETADDLHCFISWRTYSEGYLPEWINKNDACNNPLNWKADESYADYSENKGMVLYNLKKIRKAVFDAKVKGPVLWVGKPKMMFANLIKMKDYHIGDYNLFYMNVRDNARLRAEKFLENY